MKSKKHPLLGEVIGSLSGRLPESHAEILGHTYSLKLLRPEGEDWAAMHTQGTTITSVLGNARKPTLAAALTAIDGVPVEQLFQADTDELEASVREALLKDAKALRDWRRAEILEWLGEELDPYVVDVLYDRYSSLAIQHRKAMEELDRNFTKRTPSQG